MVLKTVQNIQSSGKAIAKRKKVWTFERTCITKYTQLGLTASRHTINIISAWLACDISNNSNIHSSCGALASAKYTLFWERGLKRWLIRRVLSSSYNNSSSMLLLSNHYPLFNSITMMIDGGLMILMEILLLYRGRQLAAGREVTNK